MKLILRDYITTLKEEGELEGLLKNILFLDRYTEITSPQKGIRQHGVDLSCKKQKTSYLFVIKQGNIDRNVWNGNKNAVRQSLEEIKDVYLLQNSNVLEKRVKIVLCTNGEILQEVKQDWDGYVINNRNENIDYYFWGIDELTNYAMDFLPNEYLVDQNKMSLLRKTLYFSNEHDNDLRFFKILLKKIISELESQKRTIRKYKKNLYLYSLVTKMCSQYCIDNDNNRVAIRINELAMTIFWTFLLKNDLFEKTNEILVLIEITKEYEKANERYLENIKKITQYSPSFPIYNSLEYKLQILESIGFISSYLNYIIYYYGVTTKVKNHINILTQLLNNNLGGWIYPVYDLNSIEINSLLNVYYITNKNHCREILLSLINRMKLKMQLSNYHPIEMENYDKAVLLEFNDNIGEFSSTNLVYSLLEWTVLFNEKVEAEDLINFLKEKYPSLSYNPWTITPNDEILYFKERNYHIGNYLDYNGKISFEGIKTLIKKSIKISKYTKMATYKFSGEPYFFIASRVNKMPIPPFIYQKYYIEENKKSL